MMLILLRILAVHTSQKLLLSSMGTLDIGSSRANGSNPTGVAKPGVLKVCPAGYPRIRI